MFLEEKGKLKKNEQESVVERESGEGHVDMVDHTAPVRGKLLGAVPTRIIEGYYAYHKRAPSAPCRDLRSMSPISMSMQPCTAEPVLLQLWALHGDNWFRTFTD